MAIIKINHAPYNNVIIYGPHRSVSRQLKPAHITSQEQTSFDQIT